MYNRLYSKHKCGRLVVDVNETNCYFASFDANLAIADINCTNGDLFSYYESPYYQIQSRKFTMGTNPLAEIIIMGGSIHNSTLDIFSYCRYSIGIPPVIH